MAVHSVAWRVDQMVVLVVTTAVVSVADWADTKDAWSVVWMAVHSVASLVDEKVEQ